MKMRRPSLFARLLLLGALLFPATAAGANAAAGDAIELSDRVMASWQVVGLQPRSFSTLPDWDVLVWDFAEMNGVMYVGGRFTTVQKYRGATQYSQPFLAAFDVNTGAWISTFRPRLDDGVYALAASPDNKRLLVGGEFKTVGGIPNPGFAALDPVTGALDSNWRVSVERVDGESTEASVHDIQVSDDYVYIGGRFSHLTDSQQTRARRTKLARVATATGVVDSGWAPAATGGRVMALALTPDEKDIYVGGFLRNVDLVPNTQWVAGISTVTGEAYALADPLPSDLTTYPFDLAATDDRLFTATEHHFLYTHDRSTGKEVSFHNTRGYGGDYQALYIDERESLLWAGGHFHGWDARAKYTGERLITEFTGPRAQVQWVAARSLDDATVNETWVSDLGMKDGVFAITRDSAGKLWVGGDPTSGGAQAVGGFAVYPATRDGQEVNLARGAKVTSSETGASNVIRNQAEELCNTPDQILTGLPRNMVDGKLAAGPRECSLLFTAPSLTPWALIDLGSEQEIDALRIWNMTRFSAKADLSDVWVAIANDEAGTLPLDPAVLANQPGTTVLQFPGQLRWYEEQSVGVRGRWVRIFMKSGTPKQLRVAEVEVIDLPGLSPPIESKPDGTLLAPGSSWHYLDTEATPVPGWTQQPDAELGLAGWKQGATPAGFGDGDIVTTTAGGNVTTYFRTQVNIEDPAALEGAGLRLLVDDGAVAYVNGQEVGRLRVKPGSFDATTPATESVWGPAERAWQEFNVPVSLLNQGVNVVAVEVHNNWAKGGDLAFDASLVELDEPVPDKPADTVFLDAGTVWRYDDDGGADREWQKLGFDTGAWKSGSGHFGYGDGDEDVVLAEGPAGGRHLSARFRAEFTVDDPQHFTRLVLNLVRDDGAIVYLNGESIARTNLPDGPVADHTLATGYAWGRGESEPVEFVLPATLRQGNNVLAVQLHSADANSKDMSFAAELTGLVK